MRRSKRQSFFERLVLLAIVIAAIAGEARADRDDDVQAYRAALAEGAERFRERDYAGARVAFERAFAIHADPVLVFNIASTYRREGELQRAVDEYRRYLTLAGPSEEGRRTLAEETIEVLEDSLERTARKEAAARREEARRQAAEKRATAAEKRAAAERAAERTAAERHEPRASRHRSERDDLVVTRPAASNRGRGVRIAGVSIGVAGAASLAYGLYELTRARDAQARLDDATRWDEREAGLLEQGALSSRRAAIAGAVGAGLVGVGLTLYWVGNRGSSERSVGVGPTLSDGGAGAAVRGTF